MIVSPVILLFVYILIFQIVWSNSREQCGFYSAIPSMYYSLITDHDQEQDNGHCIIVNIMQSSVILASTNVYCEYYYNNQIDELFMLIRAVSSGFLLLARSMDIVDGCC